MSEIANKLLKETTKKDSNIITTSEQFKKELIDYFGTGFDDKVIVEVGCAYGHTTKLLSVMFKEVYCINDNQPHEQDEKWRLFKVKEVLVEDDYTMLKVNMDNNLGLDFDNVYYFRCDCYSGGGWPLDMPDIDVAFIDCVHTEQAVISDMDNSLGLGAEILVFDDYGLFPEVKLAVDKYIEEGKLKLEKYIGLEKGVHTFVNKERELLDYEGVICSRV